MLIRRALGLCLMAAVVVSAISAPNVPAQTGGIDDVKQLAGKWQGRGARGRTAAGGGGVTEWNITEDGSVTGIGGINNAPFTGRVWLDGGKILYATEGAGGGSKGSFTLSQDRAGKKTLTGNGRANRGGQMLNFELTRAE